jgi:hypothetical protein
MQLTQCEYIHDIELFLASHKAMAKKYQGKERMKAYEQRLKQYYELTNVK